MPVSLHSFDPALPGALPARANPRSAGDERLVGPSIAQILIALAWIWCAALGAHVPLTTATTGLAAAYGMLFMVLLPFNRWACFLVLVAVCASEIALRAWSPIRYNTVHYATFPLLVIALISVRPRAGLPKPLIFWLGMCVWFAVTFFWSENSGHWVTWVTEYFGLAGLALLTRQLATSPRRRQEMGAVFALTALAVIAALLLVFGYGHGTRLGAVAGMNPNGVGRVATTGMILLAISSVETDRRRLLSPGSVTLFLALGVGLMLSQSRGSMLALACAALTIALEQPRLQHRLLALGLCGVLGTGFVLAAMKLDPAAMQHRWDSTFAKDDLAGATAGRSEIARTAGYLLRDNWIAGVGAGQFADAYQDYSVLAKSRYKNNEEGQAHSGYLKVATEGGVVALLLMIGFYLSLWLGISKLPPGQQRALARAIVIYVLVDLLSSEGIEKQNWLAIGLLFVWFWENRHLRQRRPRGKRAPVVRAGA